MSSGDDLASVMFGGIRRLSSQIGEIEKAGRNLTSAPGEANTVFEDRGDGRAVEMQQFLVVNELSQPSPVLAGDLFAPLHLLIKFHADLEDFFEVVLVVVQHFVHIAIADENDFCVDVNR